MNGLADEEDCGLFYDILNTQTIQNVPGGKVNILGGNSIGHSKQNVYTYMYMCPILNGFRDRLISLYSIL
jgi:hypothetical protein